MLGAIADREGLCNPACRQRFPQRLPEAAFIPDNPQGCINGNVQRKPSTSEAFHKKGQMTEQIQVVLLQLILVLVVALPIPERGGIEMKKSAAQNGQITVSPCGIIAPRSLGDYLAGFRSQS